MGTKNTKIIFVKSNTIAKHHITDIGKYEFLVDGRYYDIGDYALMRL